MRFKLESKEKFHVIKVSEPELTASLSVELATAGRAFLSKEANPKNAVRNLIIDLGEVGRIELPAAETLTELQTEFYGSGASFVICCLQPGVENTLELAGLLELLNITPTETEAWDIVQMEEIERELMGGDDE